MTSAPYSVDMLGTLGSVSHAHDSEDRFLSVFGSRRTPSSRPISPLSADYDRASYANLCPFSDEGDTLWRLYCQKGQGDLAPLLWLVSYLPSHRLIFCSSRQDWQDEAQEQIILLASILGDRGTFATPHGPSHLGVSKTSGFALGLSVQGDCAHLISPEGHSHSFWSAQDLASDPEGIWDAITHTLLAGAPPKNQREK